MRIAHLARDAQTFYAAPWLSLAERVSLTPVSQVSDAQSGYIAFDLYPSTMEGTMAYFGLPPGAADTFDAFDMLFWFRLPEGNGGDTILGPCTFRARNHPPHEGSNSAVISRYWSDEDDPLQIVDWVEIGVTDLLTTDLREYTMADPGVSTAKWLGFRFTTTNTNNNVQMLDVRQQVEYPRQPIEIENADNTQHLETHHFAEMFRGIIPTDGDTVALSLRNETGDDITATIVRVANHENSAAQQEIRTRLFLSTDNVTYAAEDIVDWNVPDGGLPFWFRYLPKSTDQSVTRQSGLVGLRLEVTQP